MNALAKVVPSRKSHPREKRACAGSTAAQVVAENGGYSVYRVGLHSDKGLIRVFVAAFASEPEAEEFARRVNRGEA